MDYIFFAFSALCLGFVVLLGILLFARKDRQLLLRHLLIAGAVSVTFYYLEISVFYKQAILFYIFNLLPQAVLLLFLAIYLWKNDRK